MCRFASHAKKLQELFQCHPQYNGLLNHHRKEIKGEGGKLRTLILFNFATIQDLQRALDIGALASGQVQVATQLVGLAELELQMAGRDVEANDAWDVALYNSQVYEPADHVSVAIMQGTFVKPFLVLLRPTMKVDEQTGLEVA